MEHWSKMLRIASLNPDTFINNETRLHITNMPIMRKIHITAIQETHIPHELDYMINGYRIITSHAIEQPKTNSNTRTGLNTGGLAILIHENPTHQIVSVQRKSSNIDTNIAKQTLPRSGNDYKHI